MTQLSPIAAIGTQFLIEIWDDVSIEKLEAAQSRLEFLLEKFEQDYSRFKPESFISQLNSKRFINNPPSELLSLLKIGINYFDKTKGIINMMVGETLTQSGYDQHYSFVAKPAQSLIPNPHDVLEISDHSIALSHGSIDVGGYGKGVAIDLLAETLKTEFGFSYYLINGGGDMYGTTINGYPIDLYLEHPTQSQTYVGMVSIANQGFAASSKHKRTWVYNETKYHHIVDTKTIYSNQEILDASFVIAANATDADVFATVALLVKPSTLEEFAYEFNLGVATFTLPSTLTYNAAFILKPLP